MYDRDKWREGQRNPFQRHDMIIMIIRCAYDKFPDCFCMGTFINSTHIKLKDPSR